MDFLRFIPRHASGSRMPKLAQMTVPVNAFYVKTVAPARNDSQVSCVSGEATTELRRLLGFLQRYSYRVL